jgi:hypothetical protein
MYDDDGEASVMAKHESPSRQEADRLYDEYVKPLEERHRGEYVGVSHRGEIVMASNLIDVVQQSVSAFGKGNSIAFRVGDRVVGRIR